MEHIQRRGLTGRSPQIPNPTVPDSQWIQILGFPPDMWPQIKGQIEMHFGHIIEEVRHPSCNWCIVRFASVADAEAALAMNEKQFTTGIWLYVTRLTNEQAQALSFPVNAPMVFSPPAIGGGKPISSPPSPKPITLPIIPTDQTDFSSGMTSVAVGDQLRRFVLSGLARFYILPIISSW